jgi:hypothetical protein
MWHDNDSINRSHKGTLEMDKDTINTILLNASEALEKFSVRQESITVYEGDIDKEVSVDVYALSEQIEALRIFLFP